MAFSKPHRAPSLARLAAAAVLLALAAGCVSPLPRARRDFYAGRTGDAAETLAGARVPERDRVLLLMERGTVRQALGDLEGSTRDFIEAADLIEQFETWSVSHGSASVVTDDRARRFRGAPYERTLLHVLTAHNHLQQGDWDLAAVESRRILRALDPERRRGFPDDAYARYVAGFGFQMIDDPSNAALQFRHAAKLAPAPIDAETGRLGADATPGGPELVVFVLLGRAPGSDPPAESWPVPGFPPDVKLYAGETLLGRAHVLTDTFALALSTAEQEAVRVAARAVTRIVAKEAVATAIDRENEMLGFLTRLILLGIFEQPDVRRWETLPRWLAVARVPCPPDLDRFRLVVRGGGARSRALEVEGPFPRRFDTRVAVVRVLP